MKMWGVVVYYAIDIILLAIIIILTIRGHRKGFVRMFLETIGYIASAVCAWYVSNRYASVVYNSYFKEGVIRGINGRITDSETLDQATASFYAIPDQLRGIAKNIGFDIGEIGKRISEAGDSGENVATALENLVVGPIVETVCKVVMFVLVMVAASIVLKFLIGIIGRLFNLPVLKSANGLLGAIFGLINGVVVVCLLSTVVYLLAGVINNEVIANNISTSFVMKFIDRLSLLLLNK